MLAELCSRYPFLKIGAIIVTFLLSLLLRYTVIMGIKDLWPVSAHSIIYICQLSNHTTQLVDEAAFTCKLRDFIVEHGFLKEHYGLRTVVIGIDVR